MCFIDGGWFIIRKLKKKAGVKPQLFRLLLVKLLVKLQPAVLSQNMNRQLTLELQLHLKIVLGKVYLVLIYLFIKAISRGQCDHISLVVAMVVNCSLPY